MAQRNVELQLQALELLEKKYGITPESFKPHKTDQEIENTAAALEKEALDTAAKYSLQKTRLFFCFYMFLLGSW